MNNLDELREITNTLSSHVVKRNLTAQEYKSGGTIIGFGLYTNKDIAVQKLYMSKGTKFPQHLHEEEEFGILYKGKVKVTCNGKVTIHEAPSTVHCAKGQGHSGMALEECWFIFITTPPDKGYPDAR